MGDALLQVYSSLYGVVPRDSDPLAALRDQYAAQIQGYGNDTLLRAVSEVLGVPIEVVGDPLLVLLCGSVPGHPEPSVGSALIDYGGNRVSDAQGNTIKAW